MRTLEALFCTISLRDGGQSVSKAASMPIVVHNSRVGSTGNGNYYCGTPPVCLLSIYLMSLHVTKSPRPSPSVFTCTYCKQSSTGWPGNETNLRLSEEIKPWEVIHSSQTIYFLQVALTARRGLVVMFLFF